MHKLLWDFEIQADHQISARRPVLIEINQKKRTCRIVDFAVPLDHRVKLKECENRDECLNLATELKKLWNMKVMIIPIVIGALGTVTTGLLQELENLDEWRPSKLLHYWDRPEYWEESLRLEETCCHSNSSEKPSANAGVKNSQKRTNNNNNNNNNE